MAKRKLTDRLIKKEEIQEEIKLIEGSNTDWITPSGQVYKDYGNNLFFPKKNFVNKHNGYLYCGITMVDGQKQRRIHTLVAKAFIPNPNNYPCVCHKDNNKENCKAENLLWETISYNTKQAYKDGLAKNTKGYEDNQSMPIFYFDLNKKYLGDFGSVSEASKALGITKTAVLNQCYGKMKTKPRCGYYFKFQNNCDFVL